MFVLGHLISAHESGAFPELALHHGQCGMTAMLPDLLSCHDWGYAQAYSIVGAGVEADLVVAHMVGDAVVHYGPRWQGHQRRLGWAYRRMGLVAARFGEFRAHVEGHGWRARGIEWDSRRGWAHTMVEYSIDQWLADRRDVSTLYDHVRAAAASTAADLTWVHDLVARHVITPSKPIETQPYRYCGALSRAERPDEFHLRGLAVKFGLAEDEESLGWLRRWLRDIWHEVGEDEMRDVLTSLSEVTAAPVRFGYPLALETGRAPGVHGSPRWPVPS